MTTLDLYDDDGESALRRIVRIAIPVLVFATIAGSIWYLMHSSVGVRREAPRLQTILATLPPPPPPPPKEEQPKEPEKKIEEIQKPTEQKQQVDAPKPITINGPAQAGGDSFNIGAGEGGGSVGTAGSNGIGEATYSRYMGSAIQQMIQQDDRVNRLVFAAEVAVWIDANGHLTRVSILHSSGDPETDDAIVAALQSMPSLDQAPPSTLQFPQRVSIRGRRAG